ncbi:MAG: hypothetical protein U1E36_05770 [Rickettsiales bacterium]
MASNDDTTDARFLSEAESDQFKTFEQEIAKLAERAAAGAENIDMELANLLVGVPDSVRNEAVAQFRALVKEMQQEKGQSAVLSPEQEKQMTLLKEQERQFLAHWLSDKTLKKLREAILSNPLFMSQVMNIGDELYKRGVFVTLDKDMPQTGQQVTAQPVIAPGHERGEGRKR